jgi:hypothetical protein
VKWIFTVAVIVAGALGGFAIYTGGWRDNHGGDRRLALADARTMVYAWGSRFRVTHSENVSGKTWLVELEGRKSGRRACYLIDLSKFGPSGRALYFDGIRRTSCV